VLSNVQNRPTTVIFIATETTTKPTSGYRSESVGWLVWRRGAAGAHGIRNGNSDVIPDSVSGIIRDGDLKIHPRLFVQKQRFHWPVHSSRPPRSPRLVVVSRRPIPITDIQVRVTYTEPMIRWSVYYIVSYIIPAKTVVTVTPTRWPGAIQRPATKAYRRHLTRRFNRILSFPKRHNTLPGVQHSDTGGVRMCVCKCVYVLLGCGG